jgi:prevent-host-death family protein
MSVIGIRQLSRETASVIEELVETGDPVVVTKQGRPVAALTAVDPSQAEDLVLSLAPQIRESSSSKDVSKAPRKIRDLDSVAAELIEEAAQSEEGRAALAKYSGDFAGQRVEVLTEVDRLFSEGADRLVGVADSLVGAWMASTRVLIGGTVDAALESARALQQRVPGARGVSRSRPAAKKAAGARRASGKRTSAGQASGSRTADAESSRTPATARKRRSRAV